MDLLNINRMDHCWVYRKLHDVMDEKMYKLAIEAIDNLIVADEVEDDLYADALMVKQFMMDTAASIDILKSQARIDKATINASLSSIHAAHDNR